MKGILGVDPGLGGGLALLSSAGILAEPMPTAGNEIDLAYLARWVRQHKDAIKIAYIEKVSAMPKQGVSSMFKFGDGFGSVKGILTALHVPFVLVPPQTWMKSIHAGVNPDLPSKERSLLALGRMFPDMDFRATARSRKVHSGMMDAVLIAAYGLKQQGSH